MDDLLLSILTTLTLCAVRIALTPLVVLVLIPKEIYRFFRGVVRVIGDVVRVIINAVKSVYIEAKTTPIIWKNSELKNISFIFLLTIVLVPFVAWEAGFYEQEETWWIGVLGEAHGMLFDILILGIFLTYMSVRTEERHKIERYNEEIEDFLGWDEKEATYRIVGNIKRINKQGKSPKRLNNAFLPSARLVKANLEKSNLEEANLSGANLSGANLNGANLSGANLRKANLRMADLRGVNLQGANLEGANLQQVNLSGSNLRKANLKRANIEGCYFGPQPRRYGVSRERNWLLRCQVFLIIKFKMVKLEKATVKDAIFTDTQGISNSTESDLKNRGAIFEDSTGDRSEVRSPARR